MRVSENNSHKLRIFSSSIDKEKVEADVEGWQCLKDFPMRKAGSLLVWRPCRISMVPGFDNTEHHRSCCEYHWKDDSALS